MSEEEPKAPVYGARITEVSKGLSIQDGKKFIDVRFDILLDGEAIEDRRLAFSMETTQEEIQEAVRANYKMYEADHASVAKAEAQKAEDDATDELMAELTNQEL